MSCRHYENKQTIPNKTANGGLAEGGGGAAAYNLL